MTQSWKDADVHRNLPDRLRQQGPNLQQLITHTLELHRVDLVAGGNLLELVFLGRVDDLADGAPVDLAIEPGGDAVEAPTQRELAEHVGLDDQVAGRRDGREVRA